VQRWDKNQLSGWRGRGVKIAKSDSPTSNLGGTWKGLEEVRVKIPEHRQKLSRVKKKGPDLTQLPDQSSLSAGQGEGGETSQKGRNEQELEGEIGEIQGARI